MAKIIIRRPGHPDKWVRKIDKLEGKVYFTSDKNKAYDRDGDFYTRGEISSLKNPLLYDQQRYPELQYAEIDENSYSSPW